jgi:hypothetical protein
MATVGASGSVIGNTVQQTVDGVSGGKTVTQALADVDNTQQLIAGGIGMAGGALGAASMLASNAATRAGQAGQQMLSNHMVGVSDELISGGASTSTISAVQSQIRAGMASVGQTAAKTTAIVDTVSTVGLEVAQNVASTLASESSDTSCMCSMPAD